MTGSEAKSFNCPTRLHLSKRILKDMTVSPSTTYITPLLKNFLLISKRDLFLELVLSLIASGVVVGIVLRFIIIFRFTFTGRQHSLLCIALY